MGRRYEECKFPGTCYVCGKAYPKGTDIWWEKPPGGSSRACHIECKGEMPVTASYLFTDRDGKSKFDLLDFPDLTSAMEKALRISVENDCNPVVVCRVKDTKTTPLLMVAGVKGAKLYQEPVPEPELPTDGPLFEWASDQRPW